MHMFEYEWGRKLGTSMRQNVNKDSNLDRFHIQHYSIFCSYGFVLGGGGFSYIKKSLHNTILLFHWFLFVKIF